MTGDLSLSPVLTILYKSNPEVFVPNPNQMCWLAQWLSSGFDSYVGTVMFLSKMKSLW